jgi:hypothetical protein
MAAGGRSHLQVSSNKLLLGALASVVIVFALFAWILWRFGFFSFSGTDPSAKIVAASISLVGGLIGSLITFVGLILKHSIDQRSIALQEETESRERIESDRNNRLAEEAERRLKVEAAIRAVGLLSTSSGQEVPPTQRAGAILTLGDLGMLPLALSLSNQMLQTSTLDAGTACWLFNKALTSRDLDIQEQAAILTNKYVAKMLLPGGQAVFPAILLNNEVTSLEVLVRRPASFALIDLLMMRSFSQWDPGIFFTVLDSIHHIWKHDSDDYVRTNTGIALHTFIQAYKPEQTINWESGAQRVSELTEELAEYTKQSLDGRLYDGKLRSLAIAKWAEELQKESVRGGAEHGVASEQ